MLKVAISEYGCKNKQLFVYCRILLLILELVI